MKTTWIKAAAKQYARERDVTRPSQKDIKAATDLFDRNNEKRIEAGLKPFTN